MAPDFSFATNDGKLRKVSDFRGKWLLLQFGATWCAPSEATAFVFSAIREKLDGRPFEFVEIYEDPSFPDIELFSFTDFRGLRGLMEEKVPEFYRVGSIPAWYLINPKGVVEAAGGCQPPGELRSRLAAKLGAGKAFADTVLDPSPAELMMEDAIFLALERGNRKAQREAWDRVLATDPANVRAICGKARTFAWLEGYPAASRYLSESLAGINPVPDSAKIFAAIYGLNVSERLPAVRTLAGVGSANPQSQYLAAQNLVWTKLPEELTESEARGIARAFEMPGGSVLLPFLAFYADSQGHAGMAGKIFSKVNPSSPQDCLGQAIFLHHQGDDSAALLLFGPVSGEGTEASASPAQAWLEMLRFASVANWAQTMTFAQRYSEVRPEKLQGLVFQFLAALRSSDQPQADILAGKIREFLAESPRYTGVRHLLNTEPSRDDFLAIGDDHVRFDMAAACVLLAEKGGQAAKAEKIGREAVRAFRPDSWYYPMLREMFAPRGRAVKAADSGES